MSGQVLGQKIKARRRQLEMTQEELGNKIGVTKATINKYEIGTVVNIKIPILESLAKALNCNPCYLLGWSDNIHTENIHTNNGMIGQNSGTVTITNNSRTLSKEELRILSIYDKLDVDGRLELLMTALKLEKQL